MKINSINNKSSYFSASKQRNQYSYFSHENYQADKFSTNNSPPKKQISFKGITKVLPQIKITSLQDIIGQWTKMKSAVYYEALDDKIYPQNKAIRKANFGFLDNVPQNVKAEFIEYFKNFTGFPNLWKIASKIENEYITRVTNAAEKISPNLTIIKAGYDPTCSVGLERAFPGSDLDKAFVVLKNDTGYNDTDVINNFKGHLWFDTDQRILSLNNHDTFPEVYTIDTIRKTLDKLNTATEWLHLTEKEKKDFLFNRMFVPDPVRAGTFNIKLANRLPFDGISKVYAKNFSYFIESVRDGKALIKNEPYSSELSKIMEESEFLRYSSVTQIKAHVYKLKRRPFDMKWKLKYREGLNSSFQERSIDEQFGLIKEIIKSVSKDNNNPHYDKYFKNDDDIKARYDRLNRRLV